jgi:nucleotide-binding universal stress UspA family protein
MQVIRTILHPTDFSESSAAAFDLACTLAQAQGARVHVLHVARHPMIVPVTSPPGGPEQYREDLADQLEGIQAADPGVLVEHQLLFGRDPTAEILRVAGQLNADLIVMGSHGRAGLVRLLLGSVAEQVLQRAPCPVVIVKEPSASRPGALAQERRGDMTEPPSPSQPVPMPRTEGSVAESLGRAHTALLGDLRRLEEAARRASGEVGPGELRARLRATQAHLTEHFRLEEQNGYMEAVRNRQPHLERTIQQLAGEHRELAQVLEALIEEGRSARCLGKPFRDEVHKWVERVRQHEARENDLVQDAFNLEMGAED